MWPLFRSPFFRGRGRGRRSCVVHACCMYLGFTKNARDVTCPRTRHFRSRETTVRWFAETARMPRRARRTRRSSAGRPREHRVRRRPTRLSPFPQTTRSAFPAAASISGGAERPPCSNGHQRTHDRASRTSDPTKRESAGLKASRVHRDGRGASRGGQPLVQNTRAAVSSDSHHPRENSFVRSLNIHSVSVGGCA